VTGPVSRIANSSSPRGETPEKHNPKSGKSITRSKVDLKNREQNNTISENTFTKTKNDAFSTISTVVDRAAYANVRPLPQPGTTADRRRRAHRGVDQLFQLQ